MAVAAPTMPLLAGINRKDTMPSVAVIGTRGYPSYYGGFETAVRRLAPYLAESGWDVTVYGRPGAVRHEDSKRDIRVRTINTRGIESKSLSTLSYGMTSSIDALRRRPDVALVMNVANGYWLPLLKARGIPTLVNVDGIEWDRAKWGKLAKKAFKTGANLVAKFGDELVYDAEAISNRWQEQFNRKGVFIPYGGEPPVGTLPLESGLKHRSYVLVVARFVPENTIPEFLEAAQVISRDADVVIVGSSGYGGHLDDRAATLAEGNPRVKWLGHVSDDDRLHALWQHAGLYFHGHSVGGTNPALVQAMACGAPILARDTVYNKEVLGSSGSFVSPTPEAIAEKALELLKQPDQLQRQAEENIKRARQHYSWDLVNDRYERALRSLIKT